MKVHEVLKNTVKVNYEMSYIRVFIRWRLRSDGYPRQTRRRRGRNRSPGDRLLWCLQPLENSGNVSEEKRANKFFELTLWIVTCRHETTRVGGGVGGRAIQLFNELLFFKDTKCPFHFPSGQTVFENYAMCLIYSVNLHGLTTKSYTVTLNQKS